MAAIPPGRKVRGSGGSKSRKWPDYPLNKKDQLTEPDCGAGRSEGKSKVQGAWKSQRWAEDLRKKAKIEGKERVPVSLFFRQILRKKKD